MKRSTDDGLDDEAGNGVRALKLNDLLGRLQNLEYSMNDQKAISKGEAREKEVPHRRRRHRSAHGQRGRGRSQECAPKKKETAISSDERKRKKKAKQSDVRRRGQSAQRPSGEDHQ